MNEEYKVRLTPGKIVARIFKYVFIALILLVYGGFMLRICSSGDPADVKRFIWTDRTVSAYKNDPDSLVIFSQKPTIPITEDGRFSVSNVKYLPKFNQIQFTIRYNNSTLKSLVEDYTLNSIPSGEAFVFILTDSDGTEYRDYIFRTDTKNVYNYRQLVFDDVIIPADGTLSVAAYFIDSVDFDEPAYGTLTVYDSQTKSDDFDAKKDPPPNGAPSVGFRKNPAYLTYGGE